MKPLLSLAALLLVSSASAQQLRTKIIVEGDLAAAISHEPGVESVIAYKGYLLREADINVPNESDIEHEISEEGLVFKANIHGPRGVRPWKFADQDLIGFVVSLRNSTRKTASEELAARVAKARKAVKAIATEKKAGEMADQFNSVELQGMYKYAGVDVKALEAGADKLELQTLKARSSAELAEASVAVDRFFASLPK